MSVYRKRLMCGVLLGAGGLVLTGAADARQSFLNYQDAPAPQPASTSQLSATAADELLRATWAVKPETSSPAPKMSLATAQSTGSAPAANLTPATPPPPSEPVTVYAPRNVADLPVCVDSASDQAASKADAAYSCIPESASRSWSAVGAQTVRTTLNKWAQEAGWTMVWRSERDWTIPAGFTRDGQFEAAVTWMFKQLAAEGVLCKVRFYEANRTVVVSLVS